jgi:hypothetical protein
MLNDGANKGAWRFQLRDRFGKWVKMYGPVSFEVQLPGVKNKSIGHGIFIGSDRYGWSKIRVDDNKYIPKGVYEIENKYITGVKAVIGLKPSPPKPVEKPVAPIAKKETTEVSTGITDAQDKALDWYTNVGFDFTNRYFREGTDISPKQKQHIQEILGLIDSSSLTPGTVLYRGRPITNEQRAQEIDRLKVGDIMEDKGIVSTSVSEEVGTDFAKFDLDGVKRRALLEITAPEGAKGYAIPKGYSQYDREEEVILPPNSKFKVTGIEEVNGIKRIAVDLIVEPSDGGKDN